MSSKETLAEVDRRVTQAAELLARAADRQANLTADGPVTPAGLVESARAGFTFEFAGRLYRASVTPAAREMS